MRFEMILFDTQCTPLIKYFVHSLQKSPKRNVKSLQLIILCVYAYVIFFNAEKWVKYAIFPSLVFITTAIDINIM